MSENTQNDSDGFIGVLNRKDGTKWVVFDSDSSSDFIYVKQINETNENGVKYYVSIGGTSFTQKEWDIILKHFPGSQK